MLDYGTAKVKINDEERDISVKGLYDAFIQSSKDGGNTVYSLMAFNPMTKRFSYKPIRKITLNKENKNCIKLVLDMGKNEKQEPITYAVTLSVTSHLYVNANGHPTTIPVNALKTWRTGKLSVGFLNDQGNIIFCPIVSVTDPVAEIEAKNSKTKEAMALEAKAHEGKKGRKPKSAFSLEPVPIYDSYRAETNDGSYFVVDRMIIK